MTPRRVDPLHALIHGEDDLLRGLDGPLDDDEDESSAEIRAQIGHRLRQLRKRLGMTQTELGIRSGGIRAGEISRFENGERLPSIETLARLSRGLGLPLRDLANFGDEDNPEAAQLERLANRLQGQDPQLVRMAVAVIDALIRTA